MSREQPPQEPTIDAAPPGAVTQGPFVAAEADNPAPPAPPGYEILGTLGRGGMGVVYEATQLSPRRQVALKMVLDVDHASPDALARFPGAAESVARRQPPANPPAR